MLRARGFSLIELLIVVAIILVIAAIAVPSYLRARIDTNESASVASLRTINSAQITYDSAYPSVGYAGSLTSLGGTSCNPPSSTSSCLIDTALAAGVKTGYSFSLTGGSDSPASSYQVFSSPTLWNYSGIRYFCSFQDAVVRYSMSQIATCDNTVSPLN